MPFMNLSQMQTELIARLKSNSNALTTSRLTQWLNQAQDEVAELTDPEHLQETNLVNTVANQRKYYIKSEYLKIMEIIDTSTRIPLSYTTESDINYWDPAQIITGTPFLWASYGYECIEGQPLTPSTLSIVSTSALDTAQKVRINGNDGTYDQTELLTLNGNVAVTSSISYSQVYSIALDSFAIGGVRTIANDSASTIISRISPNQYTEQRQPLFLYPIPSGVLTYRIKTIRRPRQMVNVQDFPDFPQAFHEMILIAALVRGHNDLMRPVLAQAVRTNELMPAVTRWKDNAGANRSYRSYKIKGLVSTYHKLGNYPANFPLE